MTWPDAFFYPDTVHVEKYLGPGGRGDAYADEVALRAEVKDEHSLVLDGDGQEVTSSATVTVKLDADVPVGSRVTLWKGRTGQERTARVLTSARNENPKPLDSFIVLSLT